MKISRRKFAAVSAASTLARNASPQQTANAPVRTAHDLNRAHAEALGKYPLPLATQPAFQFKA